MKLANQTLVITGGASGIGYATVLALAAEGANLIVADRDVDGAMRAAAEVRRKGGKAFAFEADVSKAAEVEALIDFAVEKLGTLNGIFNNAGIGRVKPFLELDPASYLEVIEVDQHSVYYGMYYAAKKMVALGAQGAFVNNASIYGSSAAPGCFSYHAAKAAVMMMTRSAALELAPHGIRVVAVAPGFVDTPILGDDAALKQSLANQHLHKKLIAPAQVASVVAFLFTGGAAAIDGSTIPVEDGFQSFKSSEPFAEPTPRAAPTSAAAPPATGRGAR